MTALVLGRLRSGGDDGRRRSVPDMAGLTAGCAILEHMQIEIDGRLPDHGDLGDTIEIKAGSGQNPAQVVGKDDIDRFFGASEQIECHFESTGRRKSSDQRHVLIQDADILVGVASCGDANAHAAAVERRDGDARRRRWRCAFLDPGHARRRDGSEICGCG